MLTSSSELESGSQEIKEVEAVELLPQVQSVESGASTDVSEIIEHNEDISASPARSDDNSPNPKRLHRSDRT